MKKKQNSKKKNNKKSELVLQIAKWKVALNFVLLFLITTFVTTSSLQYWGVIGNGKWAEVFISDLFMTKKISTLAAFIVVWFMFAAAYATSWSFTALMFNRNKSNQIWFTSLSIVTISLIVVVLAIGKIYTILPLMIISFLLILIIAVAMPDHMSHATGGRAPASLKGQFTGLKVLSTFGTVLGTAGIVVGSVAIVNDANEIEQISNTSDLEKQIKELKDDTIIHLKDDIYVGQVGTSSPIPVVQYVNDASHQLAGISAITLGSPNKFDNTRYNQFTYESWLNVFIRLERKREQFIVHLKPDTQLTYKFYDTDDTTVGASSIIRTVEFRAGAAGGDYYFKTNDDNTKVIIGHSDGVILQIGADTYSGEAEIEKSVLFPAGNKKTAEVQYHSDDGFVPTKTSRVTGGIKGEKLFSIDYYSHIGYAFQRGLSAVNALKVLVDHQ